MLDAERKKRLATERDAKAVRAQVGRLTDEVVVSFGKVTQKGETLGSVYNEAPALIEFEKKRLRQTRERGPLCQLPPKGRLHSLASDPPVIIVWSDANCKSNTGQSHRKPSR